MSVTALHLYEQLTEATDDKTRARVIAEAFGQLEDRYPHLKEVATQSHLKETELRLQKEIEQVRLEIKEVDVKLRKEIGQIRLEIKEAEAKLLKEIRCVDLKVAESKADPVRWIVGVGILQTTLIAGLLMKMAHFL